MFSATAVLGNYAVPFVEKVRGDILGCRLYTVERIVDIGLELAATEFSQAVGRYEQGAVEECPPVAERRHSRQTDAHISAKPGLPPVGKEVRTRR